MFSEIVEEKLEDYSSANKSLKNVVDPFDFITSVSYGSQDPTPFQRVVLKTIYHLWDIYPPDNDERILIELEERKWGLKVDLSPESIKNVVVMILGRRSGKSVVASFIANIDIYGLISLGNPQKYYNMIERYPIHILHVAAKGDQAADMFVLSKNLAKKITFFQPYINFDKDNTSILGFYTPYDLYLNNKIRERNRLLPRGVQKENLVSSSLAIESVSTSGATNRGKAIYTLILSELAHFPRAKTDSGSYTDNPQTDHAIVTGLVPSLKDFRGDGKLIIDTSPAEKGGEAYTYYVMGGGQEVDRPDDSDTQEIIEPDPSIQVFQFSTWEVSPVVRSREELESEFKRDSVGAEMEYGAHFSNPSAQFISEKLIALVPKKDVKILRSNTGGKYKFVIAVDPGGKAKKKQADTYAVAWAHYEFDKLISGRPLFFIDGLHGWDAQVKILPGSNIREVIPVDPNEVVNYIIDLVKDLGGPNYIYEIVYDQWNSSSPISTLQDLNYPAIETTFTNPYKAAMYGTLFNMLEQGQANMYSIDEGGYIYRWKLEMKYLQKIVSGNVVYYAHPSSGPVQHDDFSDVVANAIYRLSMIADPTRKSLSDRVRNDQPPVQHPRLILPKAGGGIWSTHRGPYISSKGLKERFR